MDAKGLTLLRFLPRALFGALLALLLPPALAGAAEVSPGPSLSPTSGDVFLQGFAFASGEHMDRLRLHYMTLGRPRRDASGQIVNAVLIVHGTGGSGAQFLAPQFASELYGPGQPLDLDRFYVILPDQIGHGRSSKPSDGLRAHFPHYDYADMVEADYRLLTQGLGVSHLRLMMGTSMGCMNAFVMGEAHPDFVDALMPLACLPIPIGGRNRMWREMTMEAVKNDPDWKDGDYAAEPKAALRVVADLLLIAGSAPIALQNAYPTREAADAYVKTAVARAMASLDANDVLYQVDASRTYDPSAGLGRITAPVMWINSGDDFINPPELGVAQAMVKALPRGEFVLIAASDRTHGHGTHTWAALWKDQLVRLLARSP